MPNATILEPLKFDTVKSPVVVIAGYSTSASFPMACAVDGNTEAPPQSHGPGAGIHTSQAIPAAPGVHSVHAKSGAAFLDTQSDVKVVNGALPVQVDTVSRVGNTSTLGGQCDANANPLAADVVCRVYEVNVSTHARTQIASTTAPVVANGTMRTWQVSVVFAMNMANNGLQYNAQVTAQDGGGNTLGTTTKFLPKA